MRKYILIILVLKIVFFTYSKDFEKVYFTRLTYLEWRVFGRIKTEDYGKKIDILEQKTFGKTFPYLDRFERITKLLNYYFTDFYRIKPVKVTLRKGKILKLKFTDSFDSEFDKNMKYIDVELANDIYDGQDLVMLKGQRGKLRILSIREKDNFRNCVVKTELEYVKTWYNYPIYFKEHFRLNYKPAYNFFFGGLGYIVSGFKGAFLFFGIKNYKIAVKKGEIFNIKIKKDIFLQGIRY